jgi:peptidoglycan hydrolase-like protein with peptidoglycan-binding domain
VVRVHPVPVSVDVQARLKARGYYHATVDGIVGPATSAAIRAFQYDHGLAVTGTITPALLRALHL